VLEMTSAAVVELLSALEGAGVEAWLDGGWGVDALLGDLPTEKDRRDMAFLQRRFGVELPPHLRLDGRP
jgi:hypothetical protein